MDRRISRRSWPQVWSWWTPASDPFRNLASWTHRTFLPETVRSMSLWFTPTRSTCACMIWQNITRPVHQTGHSNNGLVGQKSASSWTSSILYQTEILLSCTKSSIPSGVKVWFQSDYWSCLWWVTACEWVNPANSFEWTRLARMMLLVSQFTFINY